MIPSAVWIQAAIEVFDSSSAPACILMRVRDHVQSFSSIGRPWCHAIIRHLILLAFIDLRGLNIVWMLEEHA